MSDNASYGFLSILRRGLAALMPVSGPPGDVRVSVPLSLSVGGGEVTSLPALALRGPGDVIGFDAGSVRRTWPAAGADNAEPNYFALVEFSEPDLPWRYTPDATSGDRLLPWLCVIVAEDNEISATVPSSRARPLAAVTVSASALPDLSQSWAWAHAQVLGAPDTPATDFAPEAIKTLLTQNPARMSARLLCPRQLHPLTNYQAFVVPTFERGRLAGLGQASSGTDRLTAAWQPGQSLVTLPVYFAWSFRTGEPGDFGALVAKLQPLRDLPETVWRRNIAISPPGADPANWQVVHLESALIPLGASIPPWDSIDAHGFTTALAARTNAEGTELNPPLYGRWLAATATLSTSATARPPWFHQLNADPRARIAAGLGTTIVQTEQQELLAGAWAQVEGIRAANERLRLAQLARELALRIYTRHFAAIGGDAFLQVSAPLHARVRVGAITVGAQLAGSPIASGALAPVFRRVTRPLGSLGVRQGRLSAPAAVGALTRMNVGALLLVPPPNAPETGTTGAAGRLGDLGAAFRKANVTPENLHAVTPPHDFVLRALTTITPMPIQPVSPATPVTPLHPPTVSPASPPLGPIGPMTPPHPPVVAPPATTSNDGFRQAASALMAQLAAAPSAGTAWVSADLYGVRSAILSRLHPAETIETPLKGRLGDVDGGPRRTDPIEPVMAAPSFPQPMYQPLTSLGREWLLPGLDQMSVDTVGLFLTNWRFVESFLVGLNHEMARKLLWNGYPTDQRGTYFRHFWDIGGGASNDGDIGPIHGWTEILGKNRAISGDPLVLLVRGELIRRYPNVIVYAAQADVDTTGRHPGLTEKHPIFFGRVQPDVALFGFDLDPAVARGNPGWFFVLQEHPSEPRFGLATPGTAFGAHPGSWQGLGWDHLVASEQDLSDLRYIDLGATLPHNPVNADPTGAVWHAAGSPPSRAADLAHITFRQPKRFAVHGSMLIPTVPPSPGGSP
ncbi:hypothetical protein AYO43_09130 [Nitrospira sp. SCGC AG-212-E16]|nr:hypothetical protein AYO43_09130 [Nitrospira sp. SCGC AG-212-E16]